MKTPPIFAFSLFFASLRCAACVCGGRQGVLARVRETFESLRVSRLLDRHVFNDVEQCSTTALFTARADSRSESLPPLDFCKACLWQVIDASIDLRDPNPN